MVSPPFQNHSLCASDFGYARKDGDHICYPMDPENPAGKKPPSKCVSKYKETKGYLKVAGNSCEGGLDLNPVEHDCPKKSLNASGALILSLFLMVIVGFVIIICVQSN